MMILKKVVVLTFFLLFAFSYSQNSVSTLMDSLVTAKDNKQIVDLSLRIANKLKTENFTRSQYYINLAKEHTEKLNTDSAWKDYYNQTKKIYFEVDALDLFQEALLSEYNLYKNTNHENRYKLETQLAILYSRLNDKKIALYYFNKLWKHYSDKKDYYYMAQTKTNIGNTYLNFGDAKESLTYFFDALELLNNSKKKDLGITIYTNIGRAYSKLNENTKALEYLIKSEQKIDKNTNADMKSWIYTCLAQLYIQTNNADKAIYYAKKSENFEHTQNTFSQKDLLETLYKAYLLKKEYKEAAHYFTQYDKVRENLNIESKAVNVEKIKIDYNNKIKAQQQEIINNGKQSSFIITICILIILLLIFSILIIRYKNRILKIKLEHELKIYRETELKHQLEIRNKELAVKTIKETEQKELFQNLMMDLKKIQSNVEEKDTKNSVNYVINMLHHNSHINNWEEFELRFSNVYESFYQNLNQSHPNLSNLDKRMCALIKLNLSTKEIANITKSTVRSIENSRTRLRKKLGLTNSKTDLNKYLTDLK